MNICPSALHVPYSGIICGIPVHNSLQICCPNLTKLYKNRKKIITKLSCAELIKHHARKSYGGMQRCTVYFFNIHLLFQIWLSLILNLICIHIFVIWYTYLCRTYSFHLLWYTHTVNHKCCIVLYSMMYLPIVLSLTPFLCHVISILCWCMYCLQLCVA
jgi:hypothetical protein